MTDNKKDNKKISKEDLEYILEKLAEVYQKYKNKS